MSVIGKYVMNIGSTGAGSLYFVAKWDSETEQSRWHFNSVDEIKSIDNWNGGTMPWPMPDIGLDNSIDGHQIVNNKNGVVYSGTVHQVLSFSE